uniref:Rac GTPase-activating protein 1 n=1 Tax=Lygus hesperus TaxID=30085 RepID=A0A0A9W1E4_LYGHE
MEGTMFDTLDEFDRMIKEVRQVLDAGPRLVENFMHAIDIIEELHVKLEGKDDEVQCLENKLTKANENLTVLEQKLNGARKRFDEEKEKNRKLEDDLKTYLEQIEVVRGVLNDRNIGLPESTMARLSFIQSCGDYDRDRLDTIEEAETTGSVITDLSYTREEDELLNDSPVQRSKKRPLLEKENEDPNKRRKSTFKSFEVKNGERLVATTTVTVEPNGPLTATSIIENVSTPTGVKNNAPRSKLGQYSSDSNINSVDMDAVPIKKPSSTTSLNSQCSPFKMNSIKNRPHNFVQKAVLKGEVCNACNRRIRFASVDYKCKDCKALIHSYCLARAPLPCVPLGVTPGKKEKGGKIGDFTPLTAPMVPPLVIHCIKEIEARGLNEVGLYRIPGNDREVKSLKEKLLRGRGVPNLSEVPDIHTVSGTLKEFLRTLKEPIITTVRWSEFVQAAMMQNDEERRERLLDIISELPQPNRDTLCYLVLHLQKVAESPETMMGPSNLSTVFGQTIVGMSTMNPAEPYKEANFANQVMLELIKIPGDHYETLLSDVENQPAVLPSTPSANNLKYFISSPNTVKGKDRDAHGSQEPPTPGSVCIKRHRRSKSF